MGTDCAVTVVADTASAATTGARTAWWTLEDLDRRWSRFRADSELSRLNREAAASDAEVTTDVSVPTATLVAGMVWAFRITDGIVDASVLGQVEAAGYDRDWATLLVDQGDIRGDRPPASVQSAASRMATVRAVGSTVTRGGGVRLDSGGVGKGLAADLVADLVRAQGATGVLADIGGDVRCWGADHVGRAWVIGAADERDPDSGDLLASWELGDAAVATSSVMRRRWVGGHHLIDPSTGCPSTSDLLATTVVADTALAAEVFAKAAVIRGSTWARQWLPSRVQQAVLTPTSGPPITV